MNEKRLQTARLMVEMANPEWSECKRNSLAEYLTASFALLEHFKEKEVTGIHLKSIEAARAVYSRKKTEQEL